MLKKDTRIMGLPLWLYLIVLSLTLLCGMFDAIPSDMIGALCWAMVIGSGTGYLGEHIPFVKQWLGGGMFFSLLVVGIFATLGLVPECVAASLSTFNGSTGFLNFYIAILLTGSVITIEKRLIVRSFACSIPCILAAIITAALVATGVALLMGIQPLETITSYVLPIMASGNGAGAVPLSKIYGEVTGNDIQTWYARAYAVVMIANLMALACATLLNKLGKNHPEWTGYGKLLKGDKQVDVTETKSKVQIAPADYAAGLCLSVVCYILSSAYASKISLINHANLGFSIHMFAFMIILVLILVLLDIVPENTRLGAKAMQEWSVQNLGCPAMVMIGVTMNFTECADLVNPKLLVIMAAVVIGACIGPWIVAPFFGLNCIEAAISAGLCMANSGGGADVQTCAAADRMDLLPYGQLSSRIGGAIVLIIASFVFGFL